MEELIDSGAFYFKVKSWEYLIGIGVVGIGLLWIVIQVLVMLFKVWNYKRKNKTKLKKN